MVQLYPHQKEALAKLRSGSILSAGVGTGKSMTSLAYYYLKVCGGTLSSSGVLGPMKRSVPLYIITTARKRDNHEWEEECARWKLKNVTIDSWNNIEKYVKSSGFYIFDEQRVVGSGAWVKSFIKITKTNPWLLLSATPGDTWGDYIPVFVANGFYKNRSEFLRTHAVYNPRCTFPKVDRWIETGRLERYRREITVVMEFKKHTVRHQVTIPTSYDPVLYKRIEKDRWNPYLNEPVQDAAGVCYLERKVVNSDPSRIEKIRELMEEHERMIIFYNFDYELEALRELKHEITCAEWNGHYHQEVPSTDTWLYFVQYAAGAEAWNCITTDTIVFYSQNYSFKTMEQAAGRIDRLNTPYTDLYYYHLRSDAGIDKAIMRALRNKETFNEKAYLRA